MNKISFVLPTCQNDIKLAQVCIFSILSLFNNNDILYIYIIVPNRDIDIFNNIFNNYSNCIKIIDENILSIYNIDNWKKQQVIKLFISQFIETDFYIVLDSDCYLTKKIQISDIVINNKPILSLLAKERNAWLLNSCKYFNIEYDTLPDYVIHVTPQLLKTDIVKKLIVEHDVNTLINNSCNEYFLYYCYIIKNYDINNMFTIDPNNQLAFKQVWTAENIINESIKDTIHEQFHNKQTLFTLFQSNMRYNQDIYLPIIYSCIKENLDC